MSGGRQHLVQAEAAWGLARCYEAQSLLPEATAQGEWLLAEARTDRVTTPACSC